MEKMQLMFFVFMYCLFCIAYFSNTFKIVLVFKRNIKCISQYNILRSFVPPGT